MKKLIIIKLKKVQMEVHAQLLALQVEIVALVLQQQLLMEMESAVQLIVNNKIIIIIF